MSFLATRLAAFDSSHFHIEYSRFLTNHIAHGQVAIARLGTALGGIAIEPAMLAFEGHYATETPLLEALPLTTPNPVTRDNWTTFYGQLKNYRDMVEFFRTWLKEDTPEAVCSVALPTVVGGLSAAALHGLIHLGFGLEVWGEDGYGLLAEGLAYATFSGRAMGTHTLPDVEPGPVVVGDVLAQFMASCTQFAASGAQDTMASHWDDEDLKGLHFYSPQGFQLGLALLSTYCQDALQATVANYPWLHADLDAAAAAAIGRAIFDASVAVYVCSRKRNDFFLLHLVTGSWSLRKLLPRLPDSDSRRIALREFLLGATAAYVKQGAMAFDDVDALLASSGDLIGEDWGAILREALDVSSRTDEHYVKLALVTHSRFVEAEKAGDERVQALAKVAAQWPKKHGYEFGGVAL